MELPDDMAWSFLDGTYYERNVEYWFRRALEALPGRVVYDIGANYGYYTLIAGSAAGAVYAFEPVSSTHAVLQRNLERNRLSNVKALKLAISAESGTQRITLYSSSGNNSLARPPEAIRHLLIEGFEDVQVETIDRLVEEGRVLPPDLIKIDTEGSEFSVLCGARCALAAHRPLLIFEHSEEISREAGYTLGSIWNELSPYGYRLLGLTDPLVGDRNDLTLYEVDPGETPAQIGTLIALPQDDTWLTIFKPVRRSVATA